MSQLTLENLDRAILEVFLQHVALVARLVGRIAPGRALDLLAAVLERAASTARLVGQIEDGTAPGGALDLLAENYDKIIHEIGKMLPYLDDPALNPTPGLGNLHLIAANARRRTEDGAPAVAPMERVPDAQEDAT